MISEALQAKLDALPAQPGCYLFRDHKGVIVYVGKARSLRARVRQYFQPNGSDYRYFIPLLERVLGDIETVLTATEKEAVLLESALIKQHQPRYNVRLRDDKEYLSLRLDKAAPWPRLEVVRRPRPDKASYFGPYPSATAARRTLKLVNKHFKLRTCDDATLRSRTRPCLEYQIKRCPGPCVFPVDREAYGQQARYVELFLEGRNDDLGKQLEGAMRESARALEFERAAQLRDQLAAVRAVQERQRVAEVSDVDRDVLGLYREGDAVAVTTLVVRAGFVRDTQTSVYSKLELPDDELVAALLTQRYGLDLAPAADDGAGDDARASLARARMPDEVLVPVLPEAHEGLCELLSERRGRKVEVAVPQRGSRAKLLALARENAQHAFRERRVREANAEAHAEALAKRLGLEKPPRTIECVDISHHQGSETVGAVVRLRDGLPEKKRYRGYHVQSVATGDDFRAMFEVLSRRFERGRKGEAGWEFPDLFVVDGGRGQLGVALAVLRELDVRDLTVCSLAKERETVAGEKLVDRVYLPGRKNPVPIDRHQAALVLLSRARDEAHRFANKVREDLLHRRRLRSELDGVAGLGPRSRLLLLQRFGSLQGVREASLDELVATPGLGRARALRVFEHLHGPVGGAGALAPTEPPDDASEVEDSAALDDEREEFVAGDELVAAAPVREADGASAAEEPGDEGDEAGDDEASA